MKDKMLNWGLLSTARINRALIPPLWASKRNRLSAVSSRAQEPADRYAREWKIPQAYGSYEALLADPAIDVIYNPLPNHLHAEWTIRAVEAGKHVLCEKPLALSVEEVDAIRAAAQRHGRVVAEAFMYRHHPQTLKVQELVNSGSLGTLKLVRGSFRFFLSRAGDVRLNPEWGGGSIWDVGCYPISYARSLIGSDPLEVFGWQVPGPSGIDETFTGQMRFAGELLAQFDCSFAAPFRTSEEGGDHNGKIDQYYLSVSIRSSVFFGWRCRAGGVISAVWVYNNKRFARSRENSATLNHAPGLRICSSCERSRFCCAQEVRNPSCGIYQRGRYCPAFSQF